MLPPLLSVRVHVFLGRQSPSRTAGTPRGAGSVTAESRKTSREIKIKLKNSTPIRAIKQGGVWYFLVITATPVVHQRGVGASVPGKSEELFFTGRHPGVIYDEQARNF